MSFKFLNQNPVNNLVIDCTVRAISLVEDTSWDYTYLMICIKGYIMKDMPVSNNVWGSYLSDLGYTREIIPNTCPDCYTVKDFCRDNPIGKFVLGTGSHAVAVIDGDYYDTLDSGNELPIYVWYKERRR